VPTELLAVNTIMFFLLVLVWNNYSWLHLLFRAGFLALTIWNGFYLLQNLGYIVKIS